MRSTRRRKLANGMVLVSRKGRPWTVPPPVPVRAGPAVSPLTPERIIRHMQNLQILALTLPTYTDAYLHRAEVLARREAARLLDGPTTTLPTDTLTGDDGVEGRSGSR